jgi:maltokinase
MIDFRGALDEPTLTEWVLAQRWFGSKAREVSSVGVLEVVPLRTEGSPLLALVVVESRFPAGTHELYQLLIGARRTTEGWSGQLIADAGEWTLYDALADPIAGITLATLIDGATTVEHDAVSIGFHSPEGDIPLGRSPSVRAMDAEQSNTSIVLNDRLALKVFRRLQTGINPELEMLRFLSERDFGHVATLHGWYEHAGGLQATLGILQSFVHGRDGWELALYELERAPEGILGNLGELGAVIGLLHTVLGSDFSDPAFAPEAPNDATLALLSATIDEEIERVFGRLPDNPALQPIVGRGEEVRDRLALLTQVAVGGRMIRTHGDLHLGQTMLAESGWVILDFEGEPARSLPERRRKRSPLRDVAGMLRSFAYLVSAAAQQRNVAVPEGWEDRARAAFLEGYHEAVDPSLLPTGRAAGRRVLQIFELEKAVYELGYELNNRPDWVGIPVAGIVRLLDEWGRHG